jgi:hypothetical protein
MSLYKGQPDETTEDAGSASCGVEYYDKIGAETV